MGTTTASQLAALERQLLEAYNNVVNSCASLGDLEPSYLDDPDEGRPAGATWPVNADDGVQR